MYDLDLKFKGPQHMITQANKSNTFLWRSSSRTNVFRELWVDNPSLWITIIHHFPSSVFVVHKDVDWPTTKSAQLQDLALLPSTAWGEPCHKQVLDQCYNVTMSQCYNVTNRKTGARAQGMFASIYATTCPLLGTFLGRRQHIHNFQHY